MGRYMGPDPTVKQPGRMGPVYSGKRRVRSVAMRRSLGSIKDKGEGREGKEGGSEFGSGTLEGGGGGEFGDGSSRGGGGGEFSDGSLRGEGGGEYN